MDVSVEIVVTDSDNIERQGKSASFNFENDANYLVVVLAHIKCALNGLGCHDSEIDRYINLND